MIKHGDWIQKMIETLELCNYTDLADCQCSWQSSHEVFQPISCCLKKGNIYGFVSDYGCGGWGLVTCLGGRPTDGFGEGQVKLNGDIINPMDLKRYSAFIPESVFDGINASADTITARECIQKALELSKLDTTVDRIKNDFRLTDGRFDRPISFVSGEIWLISMAVQFALNKEIFCFPWLNMRNIFRFEVCCELGIADKLRKAGKILLVPTSQLKIAKKHCDHVIVFEKRKISYKK